LCEEDFLTLHPDKPGVKVVDANVIIHGRGLNEKLVSIPEVIDELKSQQAKTGLNSFNVETRICSEENLEKVQEKSESINSETSEVDEKVLALALDLNEVLITDDKGLQNLAHHIGVDVEGFMDPVTDKVMSWKMVCPSCGSEDSCSCGVSQIRKLDECSSV